MHSVGTRVCIVANDTRHGIHDVPLGTEGIIGWAAERRRFAYQIYSLAGEDLGYFLENEIEAVNKETT